MVLGFAIWHFFLNPQATSDGKGASTNALFAASFPNALGEQKAISDYKGKTIIVNFWATWCEPCREEMPALSDLHTAYAAQDVMVLGIAIEDVETIANFNKELTVAYPLLAADYEGMDLALTLGNNKSALPYTVIIQPNGSIHQVFFGKVTNKQLEESLSSIL